MWFSFWKTEKRETRSTGLLLTFAGSPCVDLNNNVAILPAQPGSLVSIIEGAEPPAGAPAQALEVADIVDPPLPPVADRSALSPPAPAPDGDKSDGVTNVASVAVSLVSILLISLMPLMH
ncbi:hypothetical protein MLD38_014470 [Melastoma candidum]|uniref:Uncharacterized protein n=1 Tax=Melastoma candidum TaxID=119954 RepID=A0ACB9RGL5_9MYRT|nr:hypothetical protein MLD38_014470 [Melastoma candidum]